LLEKNQVYYLRLDYKTHKHYNYFTKIIKAEGIYKCKRRPSGLIKRGSETQALEVRVENALL
jgi:hypothetical protein